MRHYKQHTLNFPRIECFFLNKIKKLVMSMYEMMMSWEERVKDTLFFYPYILFIDYNSCKDHD